LLNCLRENKIDPSEWGDGLEFDRGNISLESLDSKDFESAMNKTATNLMRMGTTNASVKDESVMGGFIEFDSFSEITDSE
jgi:hypothetical protein